MGPRIFRSAAGTRNSWEIPQHTRLVETRVGVTGGQRGRSGGSLRLTAAGRGRTGAEPRFGGGSGPLPVPAPACSRYSARPRVGPLPLPLPAPGVRRPHGRSLENAVGKTRQTHGEIQDESRTVSLRGERHLRGFVKILYGQRLGVLG